MACCCTEDAKASVYNPSKDYHFKWQVITTLLNVSRGEPIKDVIKNAEEIINFVTKDN